MGGSCGRADHRHVDTTAAEVLERLDDELASGGIHLVFAELKGPVKDRLERYGLGRVSGPDRFYPTIGTVVSDYVGRTGTTWTDWTDVQPPQDGRTTSSGRTWEAEPIARRGRGRPGAEGAKSGKQPRCDLGGAAAEDDPCDLSLTL